MTYRLRKPRPAYHEVLALQPPEEQQRIRDLELAQRGRDLDVSLSALRSRDLDMIDAAHGGADLSNVVPIDKPVVVRHAGRRRGRRLRTD